MHAEEIMCFKTETLIYGQTPFLPVEGLKPKTLVWVRPEKGLNHKP